MNGKENNKKVVVVIPCRNEEKYIEKCLHSIVNCNYPKEFLKVFAVDGMSDDGTKEKIVPFLEKYLWIQVLANPKKTTPFALNMGINASPEADIIIILGAHAEISPDYIDNCIKTFDEHPDTACVGGVLNNISETKTTEAISYAMSSSFGVGNSHFRTGNKEGYVDTVAFGAFNASVFKEVGLFDEELIRNQDDEFSYRLIKNGKKIYLSKSIWADYYVRSGFNKLFRQYYQYGYWKVYVNKKHKAITTLRQLVPMLFIAFLIAGGILSIFSLLLFKGYVSILVLYVCASLIASLSFYRNFSGNIKMLFSFFILHTSYGLGYWRGIWDFIVLNKKMNRHDEELTR